VKWKDPKAHEMLQPQFAMSLVRPGWRQPRPAVIIVSVLAVRMVSRALDAGTPTRWVAGDEVYGDDPHVRATLAGPELTAEAG
jgi:hypothetical protein